MNAQDIKNTLGEGGARVVETAADVLANTGAGVAAAGEIVKPAVSNVGQVVKPAVSSAAVPVAQGVTHVAGQALGVVGGAATGGAKLARNAAGTVSDAATAASAAVAHNLGKVGLTIAREVKVARAKAVREARDVAREAEAQRRAAHAAAKKAEAQAARALAAKQKDAEAAKALAAKQKKEAAVSAHALQDAARKAAEQALRASESKAVKALELQTSKRLVEHEKTIHELEKRLAKMSKRRRRGGGGLLPLVLVAGGGYYLARNPALRHRILDTVRGVSPQAADFLHNAGRQARALVGEVWIEREEAPVPASQTSGSAPAATPATPPAR